MKKLILFSAIFFSMVGFGQTKDIFSVGPILTNYTVDTRDSPSLGVGLALTCYNVYFDMTSNWVGVNVGYYRPSMGQSHDTGKTAIVSGNIGYALPIGSTRFIVTPTIGMSFQTYIWEDQMNNKFGVDGPNRFNFGGNVEYKVIHPVNVLLGYSIRDGVKAGVIIDFSRNRSW